MAKTPRAGGVLDGAQRSPKGEAPGGGAESIRVPSRFALRPSTHRSNRAPPSARNLNPTANQSCGPCGRDSQKSELPHLSPQFRDPLARKRDRHPHGTIPTWPRGRINYDDLAPRHQTPRGRSPQPVGSPLNLPEGTMPSTGHHQTSTQSKMACRSDASWLRFHPMADCSTQLHAAITCYWQRAAQLYCSTGEDEDDLQRDRDCFGASPYAFGNRVSCHANGRGGSP